jgi:hypothetical protein
MGIDKFRRKLVAPAISADVQASAGSIAAAELASDAVETAKIKAANVTPAKLSDAANSRVVAISLEDQSASDSKCVFVAPVAGTLNAAWLVVTADITGNDTNKWTVVLTNRGSDGSGTDVIVTKAYATGVDLTAYDASDLGTLANNTLAAGDVVSLDLTKANSPSNLEGPVLVLEFLPS